MIKNNKMSGFGYSAFMSLALFATFGLSGPKTIHAMVTRNLDIGSTGADVSEVQTYYSTDSSIYPSKLVTGYFGSLTAGATEKFQTAQSIVTSGTPETTGFGRVGPKTAARLNSLMGGTVSTNYWGQSPILNNLNLQTNSNSVVVSWSSNTPTLGQVFLDVNPIRSDEATDHGQTPYISGSLTSDGGGIYNHSITISNLQSNTYYYYVIRSIDTSGNISLLLPSPFRTN